MEFRTQVIIAGAGPAGLAAAIELGRRGVQCCVIERNDRVGLAPRAKTTHLRTREHLRRWGIADRLARASPFGVDFPSNVIFATRLSGYELARFENAFSCAPQPDERYAEHAQWIPQYLLEEVLREHAQSLPCVSIQFEHEVVAMEQTSDGVKATVKALRSGRTQDWHARYLIGADGARSRVRDLIGVPMHGESQLSRNYNIVFRAPGLSQAHQLGPAIMYWLVNPDLPGLTGPMDSGDRWFFMPTAVPAGVQIDPASAPGMIRRATGIDLPFEILSSDQWTASSMVADRYADRRVFLIGDACHVHPPFGGYGMNMGFGDGVDLGWKMAAVLQGWAGEGLLQTYQSERKPIHELVIAEAVANHAVLGRQLWREGLEDPGPAGARVRAELGRDIEQAKKREFHAPGVVKGYRYRSTAILEELAAVDHQFVDWRVYEPSARPGSIAPHCWLNVGKSLYDEFGEGFTLLFFGTDDADLALTGAQCGALVQAAEQAGIPLHLVPLVNPLLCVRYAARFVLIRPDQHVAWRGEQLPQSVDEALGKIWVALACLEVLRRNH